MRSLLEHKGIWSLLFLMVILITGRYGDLMQWSDHKVIEPYGDGFKAYTVIQYHAQYDSTYSFFEGMNYPYGDHAIPAATQPLVSNSLKFLSTIFGNLSMYTIPVVNFSMLLSILLTAIFVFLIFKNQKLPDWYAVLAAIGITFLAPQTHRMIAHYGLTHPEVIPAVIYFLLRFSQSPALKWSFAIAVVAFLYPLLHFYYFPIIVFMISFYFLISFLREWDWKKLGHYALHYGIQVGLPLLFFVYWLILNDPIADRSSKPWGFLVYSSKVQGVFASMTQPHFQLINDYIIPFGNIDFEGKSYLGLIGIFFFFLFLIQWVRRWVGKGDILPTISDKWFFDRLLLSTFIIFLFALGLPFIIPGLEFLLDYTGPIKQFRGIGRFAWMLYYSVNIVAFIYLFKWRKGRRHWLPRILPFAALCILFFEAYHFTYAQDYTMEEVEQMKPGQQYTDSNIDFSGHQAILPIPYYNVGSGNFWWPYAYSLSMQQSLVLSLQTGLPVTAAMLTRTSPAHAIKQLQLVLEPYRLPLLLKDLPNDQPFLMLWDHTHLERPEYKDYYMHFQGVGRTLYDQDNIRLASLSLESFEKRIEERVEGIKKEMEMDSLHQIATFMSSSPDPMVIYEPFSDKKSDKPYLGNGGLMFNMSDEVTLFSQQLPDELEGNDFEVQLWMYIQRDLNTRSMITLQETDQEGNVVQTISTMVWRTVRVIDDTGWAMLEIPFQITKGGHTVRLSLTNEDLKGKVFYIDELLIKAVGTDLYQKTDDYLWKNNRWFPIN